ncbi:tetratricopeptide repeat protein [Anaeromyxobacter paludicola]|uniref:Tetratricopeptide repeat protein n=1 Tax=Anaeromyxobacter paludicola TaxID=2918171 RepID=A0ABM7X6G4_9BACT|nr:tetratricopeptide repeat protein [Anaeromyxobacter paludicola]BDG07405.1 hypothetical protein AMPC_05180 [Anaeromyxobacter paludicola]
MSPRSTPPAADPSPTWKRAAPLACLLASCALAWRGALAGGFHYDDRSAILDNRAIKDLAAFLAGPFWQRLLADGRPLTDLTFALDYRLAGLSGPRFHLTSLVLHLAAVALAWALARRALRAASGEDAPWLAAFCAALFGLHPVQAESVSYLAQRSEVLASALALAVVLLLLRAEEARRPAGRLAAAALALACFALAMAAKPVAITAPLAFLLFRACLGGPDAGPRPWRLRLALAAPLLALGALFAFAQLRAVGPASGRSDAGFAIPGLSPGTYLLSQARAVVGYLRLLLLPVGQTLEHDLAPARGLDPATAGCGALLLALLVLAGAAALRLRGRPGPAAAAARLAAFGTLWFFLLLAPTSTVLPLADVMMEHRVYLASLGLVLAAGAAGLTLLSRPGGVPRPLVACAGLALLAAAAGATSARNRVWRSDEALWREAVAAAPSRARPHMNLGFALQQAGRLEEAAAEYARTLALPPEPNASRPEVLRNLSATLIQLGRLQEASTVLQEAAALSPLDADLENNLGILELELGRLPSAATHASRALALEPDHGGAHNTLGEVRFAEGRLEEGLREFEAAVSVDPDVPARVYNLALARERLGRPGACDAWRRFLSLAPAEAAATRRHLAELSCPAR